MKQKVSDNSEKLDDAPTQSQMSDPSSQERGKPNYKLDWAESPADLPRNTQADVGQPAYIANRRNRWGEYR